MALIMCERQYCKEGGCRLFTVNGVACPTRVKDGGRKRDGATAAQLAQDEIVILKERIKELEESDSPKGGLLDETSVPEVEVSEEPETEPEKVTPKPAKKAKKKKNK